MNKIYQKLSPVRKNVGFTLIELLVVVLIIGILSAIALPRYEKAVEKSRSVQAVTMIRAVADAYQRYYMANGVYPQTIDELDVQVPWTGTQKWYPSSSDSRSNGDWSCELFAVGSMRGIYVGRLSGPYKGAALAFFVKTEPASEQNRILCIERLAGGVNFTKDRGEYCHNIMGGTYVGQMGAVDAFRLP